MSDNWRFHVKATRLGRPMGVRRPPKAELSLLSLLTYMPLRRLGVAEWRGATFPHELGLGGIQ